MTSENSNSTEHLLDAKGLFCPEPVMLLHKKIREINDGEVLVLVATDPSTTRDVPKFCHFLGHELLSTAENDKVYRYSIRKSSSS
ncbi:sulfurtransferase TusA [Gammaproteobacteria bacterium]|jgi:tRNA 2-thiouridine synthesizing protein A|nr:sulfurtransferase TusA [Gammaproteobacteria bacterium]